MNRLAKRLPIALTAALTGAALAVAVATTSRDRPVRVETAPASVSPTTGAPSTTTSSIAATTTTTSTSTSLPATTTTTVARPSTTTTTVADGSLRPGDSGPSVLALQQRLRALGYWLGTPDGSYGYLTEQAVTAFQKAEGLGRDGIAGPATRAALDGASRPTGRSATGDLIEVDKARQLLLVIRDGEVAWAINASTGTEKPYRVGGRTELADTPPGQWQVTWAVNGVDVGELGALYRPRYFHGDGIAVHGYHDVPAYPASHGCVRVTEAAMDWIWAQNVMPSSSAVWVY
jgi:peptidoglycan hydrolase-like protein with peptidoglycan-binding domain